MSDRDHTDDVPHGEDLQSPEAAEAWAASADRRRPERVRIRTLIADALSRLSPGARVLELGAGPGFLAETILDRCPQLASYTLFDFSKPMLEMSRARLGRFAAPRFVLGDFRSDDWADRVPGPFEAIVSMQAVHEVRHKRHVPRLYGQIYNLLSPGGIFLMCDRTPPDESPQNTALFMTAQEQIQALIDAGFSDARVVMATDMLALCECRRPVTPG